MAPRPEVGGGGAVAGAAEGGEGVQAVEVPSARRRVAPVMDLEVVR